MVRKKLSFVRLPHKLRTPCLQGFGPVGAIHNDLTKQAQPAGQKLLLKPYFQNLKTIIAVTHER